MAGTTTKLALRYPSSGDADNVPQDIQNLANDVEAAVSSSGLFVNRPAAGHRGKIYQATDTGQIFRDNGTTWDELLTVAEANAAYPSLANFNALRGKSAFTSGAETTTSTSYTALTTATSVDVTAPASGIVLVQFGAQQSAAGSFALTTVLVTVVAGGATFFDAGDAYAAQNAAGSASSAFSQVEVTGLTPGTPYRFALRHRVSAGTGTFQSRNLVALPQA